MLLGIGGILSGFLGPVAALFWVSPAASPSFLSRSKDKAADCIAAAGALAFLVAEPFVSAGF